MSNIDLARMIAAGSFHAPRPLRRVRPLGIAGRLSLVFSGIALVLTLFLLTVAA
jgi:hypothetical protein